MKTVNVYEAKTHLSKLLDLAAAGEEVIIARAGRPLAKLVGYRNDDKPRKPGYWKSKVKIAPNFDELPPALASAFRGEAE